MKTKKDPYDVVRQFEAEVADFTRSLFAVSTASCTSALLLCCAYQEVQTVEIPKHTYPGVPCSIIHAGGKVEFRDEDWTGEYQLRPYPVWDSAKRFKRGMYREGQMQCLSFHAKKHISIGRGGMILTDNEDAVVWLKKARFDGRNECSLINDDFDMLGWNCYMTPEQAARGLVLLSMFLDEDPPDIIENPPYPDLSQFKIYGGE
jgi:dTDP-4-amino-4,6-dideoxygalactose transaminase